MTNKLAGLTLVVFIFLSSAPSFAETLGDETAASQLIATTKRYWEQKRSSKHTKYKYEVMSVNRVYERPSRDRVVRPGKYRYFYVLVTLRSTLNSQKLAKTKLEYIRVSVQYNHKFIVSGLACWETFEKFRMAIAALDRSNSARTIYPSRLRQAINPMAKIRLYVKERAPRDIAIKNSDVIATTRLLKNVPSTRGLSGAQFRSAARARQDIFVRAHYFVGRIEMRRAAVAKWGKLAEKQELLKKAIKKWASNMDTDSMKGPRPTMAMFTVLEPAEEAFARRLAEQYASCLKSIRFRLRRLLSQIAYDAESLRAAKGSKSIIESLPIKAQQELVRGKESLGGPRQVDDFGIRLVRAIVPVLIELNKSETAKTPADAFGKLVGAMAKAEAEVARDAARQLRKKP